MDHKKEEEERRKEGSDKQMEEVVGWCQEGRGNDGRTRWTQRWKRKKEEGQEKWVNREQVKEERKRRSRKKRRLEVKR